MSELLDEPILREVPDTFSPAVSEKAEWLKALDEAVCPASGLGSVNVPAREPILGPWFKQGDLGFIFGPRGLGKTWLAMYLARCCAEGGKMGDWQAHKPRRVLYVDGEMSLDDIRQRDTALTSQPSENMFYLQHEALFHLTGKVLNLARPDTQAVLLDKCRKDGIEILFLDNLSCLFTGVNENEADDWEKVLPWLLDLRRERIGVVFIAHAGRNGQMRGTSRREDSAFWIIQLSEVVGGAEVKNGAQFVARFVKNRNATDEQCPALAWSFCLSTGAAKAQVVCKSSSPSAVFRQLVEGGLTSAKEIAEEMGVTPGTVSKLAKAAIKAGWLRKIGRGYALVNEA